MDSNKTRILAAIGSAAVLALTIAACGGSASSSPTSPTPTPASGSGGSGSAIGAVVTITSAGVSPSIVTIQPGQQVQFVNQDSSTHVPSSDPHPTHIDCPPINSIGTLGSGQSGVTAVFTAVQSCGYHDHNNPDDARFRGQIRIGTNDPAPGY